MGPPSDDGKGGFWPLRSKTIRLGLGTAAVGGAALAYSQVQGLENGAITRIGPWAVRLGLSLAAGYFVGALFRRARAKALGAFAAITATALALRYFGVLDDPALQQQIKDVAGGVSEGLDQAKGWVYGLLPDGVAAGAGSFLGVQRDPDRDS